jgi:BASS family bile acid:Na+ symporter
MILPVVAGFIFNLFSKAVASRKVQVIQLIIFVIIILFKNTIVYYTAPANEDLSAFSAASSSFGWDMFWFFILPALVSIWLKRMFSDVEKWIDQILAFLSMAGIAVIITIITAAGRDSLLEVGMLLIVSSFIHNMMGYTLGYSAARLFGMPQRDCRTVAFEVGMQNGGLASGLALQMGKIATVGLAPAIFGPLMNITGSSLATYWRGKPYTDKK